MHDFEKFLPHPSRAENPVIRLFVALLEAVHDVVPHMATVVMENGTGLAGGDLHRVQQEFKMSRDIHNASIWLPFQPLNGRCVFLFSSEPSRGVTARKAWIISAYGRANGVQVPSAVLSFRGKTSTRGSGAIGPDLQGLARPCSSSQVTGMSELLPLQWYGTG